MNGHASIAVKRRRVRDLWRVSYWVCCLTCGYGVYGPFLTLRAAESSAGIHASEYFR